MVVLIVLNIILIVAVIFLAVYLIKNKKDDIKNVCVNCDNSDEDDNDETECVIHKQNKKIKSEKVFVGRFVTEEEYQQMTKNRKSDISILLEEVNKEYEHLKELNK
jgi:short subunit fatty acids transporter